MTSLSIGAAGTGSTLWSRAPDRGADVSFARTAWCDLDGDGVVDPRPALQGGDAIMLVPTHDVATTYPRALPFQAQTAQPVHYSHLFSSAGVPRTMVAAAVATYHRYGRQLEVSAAPHPNAAVMSGQSCRPAQTRTAT